MKHISENDLILQLLGEARDAGATEAHLADCGPCRRDFDALEQTLHAVSEARRVPERAESYGREVWQRLERRLSHDPAPAKRDFFPFRVLAFAAVSAILLTAAFLAGRFWRIDQPAPLAAEVRERVLLIALDEHLDRSQAVLIELANAPESDEVDISGEQARANELIANNRLYRQTASRAGERGVTSVLDELERFLLDVAHGPSRLSAEDLTALRQRIDSEGLLFKVRVIASNVRERGRPAADAPATERKTI